MELALSEGVGFGNAWYSSQKEHCLGWLAQYDSPGAYNRKITSGRDARFFYNHGQCAPMLVWLAEAVCVPSEKLSAGIASVLKAGPRNASQCGAFRKHVTWDDIEERLPEPKSFISRLLS
ncbi:hypothetical protein FHY55_06700 [Oceanicola sp. D3]|nr:hypothetical protein FHY55_06700 [Oceanicola sp. D3]